MDESTSVTLPAALDRATVFECNARFHQLLAQHGLGLHGPDDRPVDDPEPTILLDCRHVRFVDSGGMRFLMEASRLGAAAGVRVVLDEPSPILMKLIRLTGVSDCLSIGDRAAVAAASADSRLDAAAAHGAHWFPVAASVDR